MDSKLFALVLVAALNPLVLRSPEPHGNVPANCEFTDPGPASRAIVADAAPRPAEEEPPPPRRTTRAYDLGPLQRAVAANDRAAFDAELARARQAGAPTRPYDDIARLWDAQFASPFFAEGSEPHRIASQYPGYEAAVRGQIFTDAGGRKYYPAAESRAFVARQTGVNLPARSVTRGQAETRATQPATGRTAPPRETRTTTDDTRTQTQPRRASATPQRRTTTATSSPAARGESTPPRPSPDPSPAASRSAAAVPAPVVPRDENTSSSVVPPAAGSLPSDVAASDADAAATGTAVTETVPPADTALTAAETATTTSAAPAPSTTATTTTTTTGSSKARSVILPAVLILIGLGVLILLFRTRT